MPSFFNTGDGVPINYQWDAQPGLPVLLLSNSIGTDLHMWDGIISEIGEHFSVLRYDARGHGASGVPRGPYSLDRLGRDVAELLDHLGVEQAHVLGLSLGGIVAQWLGIHIPQRVQGLVLSNTAAYLGPPQQWDRAIANLLEAADMRAITEAFLGNWFPGSMLQAQAPVVERFRRTLLATHPEGIAGSWAAIRDADLRRTVSLVRSPTLVIAGEHDPVTNRQHGVEIAAAIPGARLCVLPVMHLSNVERPGDFVREVTSFLLTASAMAGRR